MEKLVGEGFKDNIIVWRQFTVGLMFLLVLQATSLTASVPEYLLKGYFNIPEHPWKVEIV